MNQVEFVIDRKKSIVLLGILLVSVIVISQLPPMVISSFEWNVEVGDELVFQIISTGIIGFGGQGKLQWLHLNNSIIIANITYLPNLSSFYTSHSFISDVVNVTKVSCRFENGSLVQENDRIIVNLISMSLLPGNSWNELDSLFLDDYIRSLSFGDMEYTWVSRYDENDFFFGHQGSFAEGTNGWKALVNMTTGSPITLENYDYIHGSSEILKLDFLGYNVRG